MELMLLSLAAFLLLILCLIMVFTVITGMSPMPSAKSARIAMLNQLKWLDQFYHMIYQQDIGVQRCDQLYPVLELGSGWGGVLLATADKYPNRTIIGYELSWVPWLVSWIRIKCSKRRHVHVVRKNFLTASWPEQSIVMCYLSPALMVALSKKLRSEASVQGLISNTFALPNTEVTHVLQLKDLYHSQIYTYQFQRTHSKG